MSDSTVKLLVFDMGHVFVDFEWESVCQGFCDNAKIDREYFDPILRRISKLGYERGKVDTNGLIDALYDMIGIRYSQEEFNTLWNHTFRENEEMAELLQTLKDQRPLYLLSNTNESHWEFLEETYKVSRHFQELILSYKVGHVKPAPEIYEKVLALSGLDAEHCLFIDDLPQNIAAASELGMQTIHFQGPADLKDRLKQMGLRC
ncbi:MAG: HAD family phosphatase [Cyanobacteria bacterium SZAS TMP-1]|nr:HAD family phosphatase [Cyanobacteria bacterium SZAS TMP-1]